MRKLEISHYNFTSTQPIHKQMRSFSTILRVLSFLFLQFFHLTLYLLPVDAGVRMLHES